MAGIAFYCAPDKPRADAWSLAHFCILRQPVEIPNPRRPVKIDDLRIGRVLRDADDVVATPLHQATRIPRTLRHAYPEDRVEERSRSVPLGLPGHTRTHRLRLSRYEAETVRAEDVKALAREVVEASAAVREHLEEKKGGQAFLVTGLAWAVEGGQGRPNTDDVTTMTPGQAPAESWEGRGLDGKIFAVRLVRIWREKGLILGGKVKCEDYVVGK